MAATLPAYRCDDDGKDGRNRHESEQLTQMLDCSQQYVSKVLKGQQNLSLETISKIESILKIELDK